MYRRVLCIGMMMCTSLAYAQDPTGVDTLYYNGSGLSRHAEVDTTETYNLGEITVGGVEARQTTTATVQTVPLAGIEQQDAASIADVARLVPAAHIQTNSRGETLIYLRNAGERQVALFFDGALLNVPWDNRVDLSFIPTSAVGSITVAKGGASVLYGANVLGGAVNLVPRRLDRQGRFNEATLQFGEHGRRQGLFSHIGYQGKVRYLASVGYADQDGVALPDGAGLRFNQLGTTQRTNTDARLFNALLRGEYVFTPQFQMAASVLHIDGAKGIAPEGHKDPDVSRVRFWRYPDWRNTMLILNSRLQWGQRQKTTLRTSFWAGRFAQTIAQFGTVQYNTLEAEQEDTDHTFGTRWTLHRGIGRGHLRMAVNALTSQHRQVDTEVGTPEVLDLRYRQHLYSLGTEYQYHASTRMHWSIGATLDGIATPTTGDKPARDPQVDYGFIAGGRYQTGKYTELRISLARKTRFPTLRELFGEALGRFKLNPDLNPERSLLAEVGVGVRGSTASGEVIAFAQHTTDTIDQRNVIEDGVLLRQRINLEGSRIWGVEVIGSVRPTTGLNLQGHLTLSRVRAFEAATGAYTGKVSEKPAALALGSVTYRFPRALTGAAEWVYTGKAFSLDEDDAFVTLAPATVINLRLAYRLLTPSASMALEAFLRLNNLTDTVHTPQLGLPAPGRHLRGGLKLSL